MKYIDFIGQALLLVATLVLAMMFLGTGILVGQFLIGVWQMLSSSISLLTDAPFRRQKTIHFISAILYLAVLVLIVTSRAYASSLIAGIVLMVPAWVLAIYYFSITWRWAFVEKRKSKFLPNISF